MPDHINVSVFHLFTGDASGQTAIMVLAIIALAITKRLWWR